MVDTSVLYGLSPQRGPWTRSTGVVHGPGVHVLYTFPKVLFALAVIITSKTRRPSYASRNGLFCVGYV